MMQRSGNESGCCPSGLRWMILPVIGATLLAGCHQRPKPPVADPSATKAIEPSSATPATFTLTGAVNNPGVRPMSSDQTIATALASQLKPIRKPRTTIVLIRRGPEGMVRQLIDVDAKGHPLDERDNIALRNGDELLVPGESATLDSLQRPPVIPDQP